MVSRKLHRDKKSFPFPPRTQGFVPITAIFTTVIPRLPRSVIPCRSLMVRTSVQKRSWVQTSAVIILIITFLWNVPYTSVIVDVIGFSKTYPILLFFVKLIQFTHECLAINTPTYLAKQPVISRRTITREVNRFAANVSVCVSQWVQFSKSGLLHVIHPQVFLCSYGTLKGSTRLKFFHSAGLFHQFLSNACYHIENKNNHYGTTKH